MQIAEPIFYFLQSAEHRLAILQRRLRGLRSRQANIGYQRAASLESAREVNDTPMVGVTLHVHGQALVNDLVAALSELPEVQAVLADDADFSDE